MLLSSHLPSYLQECVQLEICHFPALVRGHWSRSTRASDSGGPLVILFTVPEPPLQPCFSFQQRPERVSGLVSHAPASPLIGILLLFRRVSLPRARVDPPGMLLKKADSEVSPLGILIP